MQIRQLTSLDSKQINELCELLIETVDGGASVGFLAPLTMLTAVEYWQTVAAALGTGLILLVAEVNGKIVGSIQLELCRKENGLHRGEIQKLFVLRSHRGNKIATQLMNSAEQLAVSLGKTLLVLYTHAGSKAEQLYEYLGWVRGGVIPDFAVGTDSSLHSTAFLYKHIKPVSI
jgi:acetyltransferase